MKPKKTKRKIIIKRKITIAPEQISYKNVNALSQFLTEQGSILPRISTSTPLKNQRLLAREVKRARHLALIKFTQTV